MNRAPTLPPIAIALRQIEAEAKERGFSVKRELVATKLSVAKSAVSQWFAGKQRPRERYLGELADYYAFGDEGRKARYRVDLYTAAGTRERIGVVGPMELARNGTGEINLEIVKGELFTDFFTEVLGAFARYSTFVSKTDLVDLATLADDIAEGAAHIGAGLLGTPNRALTIQFVPTPINLGVNALTFARGLEKIESQPGFDLKKESKAIRPIVTDKEVGQLYATYDLGWSHMDMDLSDYTPKFFADRLIERFQAWKEDDTGKLPVIFADEVMLFKIHLELTSRLIVGAKRSQELSFGAFGPPVLLMGRERSGQSHSMLGFNPTYNLSICLNRDDDKWIRYVNDAWRIFVKGNIEFLAEKYWELFLHLSRPLDELAEVIEDNQAEICEQWRKDGMYQLLKEDGHSESIPDQVQWQLVGKWRHLIISWLQLDRHEQTFPDHEWSEVVRQANERRRAADRVATNQDAGDSLRKLLVDLKATLVRAKSVADSLDLNLTDKPSRTATTARPAVKKEK